MDFYGLVSRFPFEVNMGCGSSANTAVRPLTRGDLNGDQDETGSKLSSRGDSAVSKGTTDSGVVMENKEIALLPGAMLGKISPLTFECVRESEADRMTQDGSPGLLKQDDTVQERQKSCEILEELLHQGIIPVEQTRERSNGAGEAYSILLDEGGVVRRRPPARLESLKAKKEQSLPSREEIEEKIRLAEERRKLREDELKTRLRTKSARTHVRAPISSTKEDEDTSLTRVEPLQSALAHDPTPALLLHSQIPCRAVEGGECVREAGGDGRECGKEMSRAEKLQGREKGRIRGDNRGDGAEWASGDDNESEDEEELNQVEELRAGQLLIASQELESDSSFQHAEDRGETF